MKRISKPKGFSQKEIAVALNNAVAMAMRPQRLGEISDKRLLKLRKYTEAIVAPLKEHVEGGYLTAEELVAVLSACSLLVHAEQVMMTDKLPLLEKARNVK